MKRHALTLIEVVASLALVAIATCVLFAAQGHCVVRLQEIRVRAAATRLARALVADWTLRAADPISAEGEFEGFPGWRWSRTVRPLSGSPTGVQEVTLLIHRGAQLADRWVWLEAPNARNPS
jgi:hypothetical protein